jgi:hypothetical protein
MPAPTGPALLQLIKAELSATPQSPELLEYLQQLTAEISKSWKTWSTSLKWGGLTVTGTGIGVWVGVGNGGSIVQANPITIPPFIFKANTDGHKAFVKGLDAALKPNFTKWASSYKFAGLTYNGASTATPLTPGVFTAAEVATPLQGAGTGTPPLAAEIASTWKSKLTGSGFNLGADGVKTPEVVDGISKALVKAFTSVYLSSSVVSGTIATGVAAPPAGTGATVSTLTGTIA